jgi:hypothetical protein
MSAVGGMTAGYAIQSRRIRGLAEDDAAELRARLDLVTRVYALRRAGRIAPIWIDAWNVSVQANPWDCRERISWDDLAGLVVAAEAGRKPAGCDLGPAAVAAAV